MYRFLKIIGWPICFLFMPTKRVNKKVIDKKKNYIFVANHTATLDIVLLIHNIHRTQYFVGKKEIFKGKLRSWFFKKMHVIGIDRKNIDLSAIKSCMSVLKEGKTLTIFPEGTRNKVNDDLQELKNGTAMFAIKSGVEILPIKIAKRPRFFQMNKLIFGEPFSLNEFKGQKLTKEVLDQASAIITEHMENLK